MVLHARGEGVPCSSYSISRVGHDQSCLMENNPIISHIIVTSFFVVLRHYLSFHGFSSLSRLGVAPTNWSNARCTKSSFQQVFICPKRIPIEGVMPLFPVTAICPVLISARASPMFETKLLPWDFNSIDHWCVEPRTWWRSWIFNFLALQISGLVHKIYEA